MFEWLSQISPVIQALIGTLFTWGVTALGAALVFFFKTINKKVLNGMLGFAAGAVALAIGIGLQNFPEAQQGEGAIRTDIATIGCMVGFAVMMILDVALG